MSGKKEFQEMTKAQLQKLPNKPEFLKASLRVLEGDVPANYEAALNGATVVALKEEKADSLYNGILGYAAEGRIRDIVGATRKDMEAALVSDFYIINNGTESFVKCTGKDIAALLKEAVKRGLPNNTALKHQIGFDGLEELTLRPITEYEQTGKFQRYFVHMKNTGDKENPDKINELLKLKKFNIIKLFEFSREIANARYYNFETKLLQAFEKEMEAAKLKKATGGFF